MLLPMSHFFRPTSKVQKDRHIMRETDARMAKYSRRGLIFNFIAFLICLVGGRFVTENRELTVILTSGLMLVTVLRGFYLFRFDQLYPRGPARWRNAYFVVTLIGAMWWGVILASITLVLSLQHEAPLLWLYTIVFFSTTAHAFAPYHRFLTYYQFFGLVPAAAAAMALGDWNGYVYGALMLMFYLILTHQCRLISDNYWEKLEAGYALGKKAIIDDQERISSRASLKLGQEFTQNLDSELKTILGDKRSPGMDAAVWAELKGLHEQVSVFRDVLMRELVVHKRIFNIRHELQYLVSECVPLAERNSVHLETSLSPNLPMRLQGDPLRFAQIVRTLLNEVLTHSEHAAVILEVQFLREYESAGELYVAVRRVANKAGAMSLFSGDKPLASPSSMAFTLARGLAELMDGDIEVLTSPEEEFQIRFNARLDVADHGGQLDFHKGRFSGKQILLVSANPAIVDIKRQELDALGFTVSTETQYKRVKSTLQSQIRNGTAVENLLVYHAPGDEACEQFLESMLEHDEFKSVNKIIAASEQAKLELFEKGLSEAVGFYFVGKPLGLYELESTFEFIYAAKGDDEALAKCRNGTIVIVGSSETAESLIPDCALLPNQQVVSAELEALKDVLEEADNPMAVVPCDAASDASRIVNIIRDLELSGRRKDAFIPIVGVGSNCSERDIAAFEVGFDDYIDLASQSSKTLSSMLRYWRSLDV